MEKKTSHQYEIHASNTLTSLTDQMKFNKLVFAVFAPFSLSFSWYFTYIFLLVNLFLFLANTNHRTFFRRSFLSSRRFTVISNVGTRANFINISRLHHYNAAISLSFFAVNKTLCVFFRTKN